MSWAGNILCFIDMARNFETISSVNSAFYLKKKTAQQRTAVTFCK